MNGNEHSQVRICHITTYYDVLGGIRTYIDILNDSLLKAKIHSKILSLNFRSQATLFKIPVFGIYPYLLVMSFLKAFFFSVRNRERYVLHAHDSLFGGVTGVWIKWFSRRPLMVTDHGLQAVVEAYTYSKTHGNTFLCCLNRVFLLLLTKFVVTQADEMICVSEYTHRYFLAQGVESTKIRIVSNGVDVTTFKPRRRAFSDEDIRLFYAGRLSQDKNVAALIKVFSLLENCYKHLRLVIIGEGPERAKIKNLVNDLELDQKVTVLPPTKRDGMANLYNNSDIFVLPSTMETGAPFSLLEAMACGRVVVVNSCGSLPPIVSNAGLAVPFSNPTKTAERIKEILDDRKKAAELASLARQRVVENFNWENCLQEILKSYAKLASGVPKYRPMSYVGVKS